MKGTTMSYTYSLPEIFGFTQDPDTELYTEPQGFALAASEGTQYPQCLTFSYETPWRVILMIYHTASHATANLFIRLPNGLYELNHVAHNRTADEVFATHSKHLRNLINRNQEASLNSLASRAHFPLQNSQDRHAH